MWERWGELLPLEYFDTPEDKAMRGALEQIHVTGTSKQGAVVPNSWLPGKLLPPSPSLELSLQKVESEVTVRGATSLLCQLDRRLSRLGPGERLEASDPAIAGAAEWFQDVSSRNGNGVSPTGSVLSPTISSKELINGKEWEARGTTPTYLHKGMDEYLGGGIGQGQLCVLQAAPKRGKTSLLLTIAYRAAKAGKKVLFVSCENYRDQSGERLSQIHRTHRIHRRNKIPLFTYIYHWRVTVSNIQHYVRQHGPFDILVIDYDEKMGSSCENDWTWRTREIYDGLRDGTARPNNLVCWTASQEHEGPSWQRSSTRHGTFGSKTKIQ